MSLESQNHFTNKNSLAEQAAKVALSTLKQEEKSLARETKEGIKIRSRNDVCTVLDFDDATRKDYLQKIKENGITLKLYQKYFQEVSLLKQHLPPESNDELINVSIKLL